VADSKTKNLRIYSEPPTSPPPKPRQSALHAVASLPEVDRALRRATGWGLTLHAEDDSTDDRRASARGPLDGHGASRPRRRLGLTPEQGEAGSVAFPLDEQAMAPLAGALSELLGELDEARNALQRCEAELAAGIPVVPHEDEAGHLAARLEAVLRGGAEAVGCSAAALYLLDDATTELKVRSCWGLPFDRLTASARPLRGATADLEAMLGHAVVLEDALVMRHWNPPEDFAAAVCVPVSTPTTLLGTLWVFADEQRDFNDRETNMLEVVAGRIAADLEREAMRREGVDQAVFARQMADARRLQRSQLPVISPLLDGWQLAGWTEQDGGIGGDFYDWFCLPDGLLAVAIGHAMHGGLEAALAASALKAALRAHGQYHREAQRALSQLNLTQWTASAGDQHASLFYGLIETASGRVCFSSAGTAQAMVVNERGWHRLQTDNPPLGAGPESDYEAAGYELQPGEVLVLATEGLAQLRDEEGELLGPGGLANLLIPHLDLPADALLKLVRERLSPLESIAEGDAEASRASDRTLLLVQRTDG